MTVNFFVWRFPNADVQNSGEFKLRSVPFIELLSLSHVHFFCF